MSMLVLEMMYSDLSLYCLFGNDTVQLFSVLNCYEWWFKFMNQTACMTKPLQNLFRPYLKTTWKKQLGIFTLNPSKGENLT